MDMIYLGFGSNLVDREGRPPEAAIRAAIDMLAEYGVAVSTISPFYESAPVPATADLPWFVNCVVAIQTDKDPTDIMQALLIIEKDLGRVRNGPKDINNPQSRPVDIDIIDWQGRVRLADAIHNLELPHPRLDGRAFVLLPLRDIAPDWRHPVSGQDIDALIAELPDQEIRQKG